MSQYSLTEHEQRCVEHLQRARALGVSLREYADRQGLQVQNLYQTKSQLKKKGALDGPAEANEAFVAVSVVPSASGAVLRLRHAGGWELACDNWPPVVEESVEIPAHTRKKRGRKKLPDDLPRVELVHDLPEAEKFCGYDGLALQPIGEEVSEQLDYIPARVLKHIRLKYACPGCDGCIKVADKPAQLLPKSNASPALLAQVVTAKYVDGLPLHRQEKQFERLGLPLSRASLANWMIKLGDGVMPLINLLNEQIRAGPLIHYDETSLQVLKGPGGDRHWMWVRAGGPPGANRWCSSTTIRPEARRCRNGCWRTSTASC